MATYTYFPTSSNQGDAAVMLYSRDLPSSSSEAPIIPENSPMYMNFSTSSGSYSNSLIGSSHRQSDCMDIQPAGTSESTTSQHEVMLNFGGSHLVEHNFSAWKDGRNEMLMMHSMNGSHNFQGQGLSLSLGTNIPSGMQISPIEFLDHNMSISNEERELNETFEDSHNAQTKQLNYNEYLLSCLQGSDSDVMKTDIPSNGMRSIITRAILSSKYLKAAQQLLDDVVNVKKAMKEQNLRKELVKDSKERDGESGDGVSDRSQTGVSSLQLESDNSKSELPAAEKQELHNKMTTLLTMLDEVDRRYKRYFHQMKMVVSWFDAIAGSGAAKPYTALALQTISCHFRCLRDAINDQIQSARKSLGELDDSSNGKGIGISRLRYVDKQLRQQRALQQLGMTPQHAWRPQRGLPETSVSILRAWLFEHFLHPYPKDSDKILLARQTGLTRSQVSNWFINARVRLWKPMIEEMYKEEAGDTEIDSNSSSETTPSPIKARTKSSKGKIEDLPQSATSPAQLADIEIVDSNNQSSFQSGAESQNQKQLNNCSLFPDSMVHPNFGSEQFISADAAYNISELERFGNRNGVSLTLGLQQCEGGSISISNETQGGFTGTEAYNVSELAMETDRAEFNSLDSENRQQQFYPSRLFHDFVA